ncbi:MAG: hypothetical protein U0S50_07170 [Sphingopyxis sp.]|uniref:hypothetical protein n=1 Tax=Sphingopyxis sp. TaxID=1908224 RepID=UPI002ABCF7F3|nr:hypothetical protein [Sphingopyxis sp.]MDZ3831581.1 hypothetical protein [Sphingopyxis sp.]
MRYLVLAATLALAACGSKSETEIASGTVTDPETGETTEYSVTSTGEGDEGQVNIRTKDGEMSFGATAEAKLPDGFTPYPGAKMLGGVTTSGKQGAGGMASFEVKGKASDVIAHFRKQAEAQGLEITGEVSMGDMQSFGAEKPGDDKTGVHVTATQNGDMVTGSFTYGLGG